MVKLKLPSWLTDSHDGKFGRSILTAVELPPGSWEMVVQEIRLRHPLAAERVFTTSDRIAPGFALVLNDEVVHGSNLPSQLRSGDELFIIATIAGG